MAQGALHVGMNQKTVITETIEAPPPRQSEPPASRSRSESLAKRQKLMDAIGADAYNGVNLFEDTQPMTGYEASEPKPGAVDLGDPRDAGVDISSIMGGASKMWELMK